MIKNNKGFTLIELIATITIMLLIVGIAIPTSINFINRGKNNEFELIKDKILVAASEFYKENKINFNGTDNILSIEDLLDYIDLDKKYFKDNRIIDPREKNKCLNSQVELSIESGLETLDKVKYEFKENTSSEC